METSTPSTEPTSLDTMYAFDTSYHSVQCSLPMCNGIGTFNARHVELVKQSLLLPEQEDETNSMVEQ
jgi:hypothetical protein